MTLGTHVAFASVLYLGGATLFGYRPDWISGVLAAIASGLPDVDLPPAKIGRLFWFISVPLERRFGHRTLTHSALMLLAVAALAAPLGLDSVDTYNPASYRGGILRLHYARARELGPWLDLVAVRGEIVA